MLAGLTVVFNTISTFLFQSLNRLFGPHSWICIADIHFEYGILAWIRGMAAVLTGGSHAVSPCTE
jgi:hypothetical protein